MTRIAAAVIRGIHVFLIACYLQIPSARTSDASAVRIIRQLAIRRIRAEAQRRHEAGKHGNIIQGVSAATLGLRRCCCLLILHWCSHLLVEHRCRIAASFLSRTSLSQNQKQDESETSDVSVQVDHDVPMIVRADRVWVAWVEASGLGFEGLRA